MTKGLLTDRQKRMVELSGLRSVTGWQIRERKLDIKNSLSLFDKRGRWTDRKTLAELEQFLSEVVEEYYILFNEEYKETEKPQRKIGFNTFQSIRSGDNFN